MSREESSHWISHLKGAPENVTLHHFHSEGEAKSAIYVGDMMLIAMDRCAEREMIQHYFKYCRDTRK